MNLEEFEETRREEFCAMFMRDLLQNDEKIRRDYWDMVDEIFRDEKYKFGDLIHEPFNDNGRD